MEIELYFDGGCEPTNPGGVECWGFVVQTPDKAICHGRYGTIPYRPENTNNHAEYMALGKGLRALVDGLVPLEAGDVVRIRGDSQLVIQQLNGKWECRAANLQPLLKRCRELLEQLPCEWSAEWVRREKNEEADALTRRAYEEATGEAMPVRTRRVKREPKPPLDPEGD